MSTNASKVVEIEAREIHVLYRPGSGRIVHVHRTTTWKGAKPPSTAENEARARALAERCGHRLAGLRTLRVEAADFDFRAHYRIDPKTTRLVREAAD
jgi:hypothetical protein